MKEVKRIFFLTKEETEVIKQEKQDIYIVYETGQAVSDEYYFLKDISFEKPEFEVNSSMYCEYCNLK